MCSYAICCLSLTDVPEEFFNEIRRYLMAITAVGLKKHADLVKAWLDGAFVQYWCEYDKKWVDHLSPDFSADIKWRVDPGPKMVPWTLEDWERERPEWIKRKSNGDQYRLVGVVVSDELMQYGAMLYCIGYLNENFTQLDGTPFEKPAEVEE